MHRSARLPMRRTSSHCPRKIAAHAPAPFEAVLRWSGPALVVLSLIGVMLSALGFGVAFALTRFGVDVFEVLHGPSDYLAASSLVVGMLFALLADVFRDTSWVLPVSKAVGGAVLAWVVGGGLLALRRKDQVAVKHALDTEGKLAKWISRPRSARRQAICFSLGGIAATVALIPALWLALAILCIAISWPTVMGDRIASRYLYEAVVEPTECATTLTADERRSRYLQPPEPAQRPYGAACLQVEAKGFQPIRGRRVIATSEVIVLFDPDTGIVRTVPRKDAVVTTLSSL